MPDKPSTPEEFADQLTDLYFDSGIIGMTRAITARDESIRREADAAIFYELESYIRNHFKNPDALLTARDILQQAFTSCRRALPIDTPPVTVEDHKFDPKSIFQDCSCGWKAEEKERKTVFRAHAAWKQHTSPIKAVVPKETD